MSPESTPENTSENASIGQPDTPAQPSQPSLPPQPPLPSLHPLGADAVIIRFSLMPDPGANAAALVFAGMVADANLPGVVEIVPSLASVLVRFDPGVLTRTACLARLATLLRDPTIDWAKIAMPAPTRRWTIPAVFGDAPGPQLAQAAAAAGLSVDRAIQTFTQTPLRVLAIGFAPGQPYLGLLPQAWDLARQSALTPEVPAGALVVAVRQVVLFANRSATGWRWVGQTTFRPFRPELPDAFAFRVGDELRFEAIALSEFHALQAGENQGAHVGHCKVLS